MSNVSNKFGLPAIQSFWEDFLNDRWFGGLSKDFVPAMNVLDKENHYAIEAALPGYSKEDVMISVDNNVLSISSKKTSEKEDKSDKYTRKEWSHREFKRSFSLPENADEDNMKATFKDGVLQVTIPKKVIADSPSSRTIKID